MDTTIMNKNTDNKSDKNEIKRKYLEKKTKDEIKIRARLTKLGLEHKQNNKVSNETQSSLHLKSNKNVPIHLLPPKPQIIEQRLRNTKTMREVDLMIKAFQKMKSQRRRHVRDVKMENLQNQAFMDNIVNTAPFTDAATKLTDALSAPHVHIHGLSPDAMESLQNITNLLKSVTDNMPAIGKEGASRVTDNLRASFRSVSTLALVGMLIAVILLLKDEDTKKKKYVSLAILLVTLIFVERRAFADLGTSSAKLITKLSSCISDRDDETTLNNQMSVVTDEDYEEDKLLPHKVVTQEIANDLFEFVATFISLSTLGVKPKMNVIEKIQDMCIKEERIHTGFAKIGNKVVKFLNIIINMIMKTAGKEPVYLLPTENDKVKSFVDKFQIIHAEANKSALLLSKENSERIFDLWTEGFKLVDAMGGRDKDVLRSKLTIPMKWLTDQKMKFEAANLSSAGHRQVPVFINICGPSSVGKSVIQVALTDAVCARTLPEENKKSFMDNSDHHIYARNMETGFWDGYANQWITVYDDIMQIKDAPGTSASEAMEVIRTTNAYKYLLNMADLPSKGTSFFNSKFLFSTSNQKVWTCDSIRTAEAAIRRIDLNYLHVPPVDYCLDKHENTCSTGDDLWMRRLDKSKCKSGLDLDACEYHEISPFTGIRTGKVISFNQLVDEIVIKFEKRKLDYAEICQGRSVVKEQQWNLRNQGYFDEDSLEDSEEETISNGYWSMFQEKDPDFDLDKIYKPNEQRAIWGIMKPMWNQVHADLTLKAVVYLLASQSKRLKTLLIEATNQSKSGNLPLSVNITEIILKLGSNEDFRNNCENYIQICRPNLAVRVVHKSIKSINSFLTEMKNLVLGIYSKFPSLEALMNPTVVLSITAVIGAFLTWGVGEVLKWVAKLSWKVLKTMIYVISFGTLCIPDLPGPYPYKLGDFTVDAVLDITPKVLMSKSKYTDEQVQKMRTSQDLMMFHLRGWTFAYTTADMEEATSYNPVINNEDYELTFGPCPDKVDSYEAMKTVVTNALWDLTNNSNNKNFISVFDGRISQHRGYMYSYTDAGKPNRIYFEIQSSWRGEKRDHKPQHRRTQQTIRVPKWKLQGMYGKHDKASVDIVHKIVMKNTYILYLEKDGEMDKSGYITFVKDRVAMMPYHFACGVREQLRLSKEKNYVFRVLMSRVGVADQIVEVPPEVFETTYEVEEYDLGFIQFSRTLFCCHSDITKYFVSLSKISSKQDYFVTLTSPNSNGVANRLMTRARVVESIYSEGFTTRHGYRYDGGTTVGDCGSILALRDPTSGHEKILGIHVAGSSDNGMGVSVAVTKEFVDTALEQFDDVITSDLELQWGDPENIKESYCEDKWMKICNTESPLYTSGETVIRPSVLHNTYFKSLTKPAMLKAKFTSDGYVDPWQNAYKNYGATKNLIDDKALQEVVQVTAQDIVSRSSIYHHKTYSFKEACSGEEGNPWFKGIPRNTSAGYPYNLMQSTKRGKTMFFGDGAEYDLDSEDCRELERKVQEYLDKCENQIRDLVVFSDYLKDERRPIEKAEKGLTRMISASPLVYTIAFRRMYGPVCAWFLSNHTTNGFAAGANPFSGDWHYMYELMNKYGGTHVIAGDISKMDGSHSTHMLWAIFDFLEITIGDETDRVTRRMLWEEVVNCRHLRSNQIFEMFGTIPSGHALTWLINSTSLVISIAYSWTICLAGYLPKPLYNRHYVTVQLGDDHLISILQDYAKYFTHSDMVRCMALLGYKYTSERKETNPPDHRTLLEVGFLKRKFRFEPILGRMVSPLELNTILEMPMWTKKGASFVEITKDNFNSALRELSMHDIETFNTWAPKMIEAYKEAFDEIPPLTIRHSLLNAIDGMEEY